MSSTPSLAIRIARQTLSVVAVLLCGLFAAPALGQWELNISQTQQMEDYLARINADELLVEHLESATANETDLETRRKLNTRLLGLYATRMMSGRNAEDSKWRKKSELILKTYPQLGTHSIRIALLQSKYREGENSFQNWWKNGRVPAKLAAQQQLWNELTRELTDLNRILEESYQDQIAASQSQGVDADSKEIIRAEELLLHTNYLLGWSTYFTGILNPDDIKTNLRKSDRWFREFLQLEPEKLLTDVPETWFDFSSQWQVRALVGLAMVQRGLNYPSECEHCFDLIKDHSNDQKTRDLRYVWEFNSRLYLNDYAGASELVESVASSNRLSKNGRFAYWTTVANSGSAIRSSTPLVAQKLLATGLTGLAREFGAAQITDFLQQNELKLSDAFPNEASFEAFWVGGLLDFHHAQVHHEHDFLTTAKSKLESAIAAAKQSTNPLDIDKCRFLIGKIDHLHRNYAQAADTFLKISKTFDQTDRELAAESQWLATRSLAELSRRDSRRLLDTNRAIDAIVRRFPGSTYAKRAEFEKLLVNLANVPPDEAIKRLIEIPPKSLNYPVALNEIVKRRYEDWQQHFQTKSDEESEKLIPLFEAELNYRRLHNATDQSKAKSVLLVIDALLRLEDFQQLQIRQRLDVAKSFVERSASNRNLLFEYRYYEFLFANRAEETDSAEQQAIWLSENAKGTRFEKSALVLLAQTADQRFRRSLASGSSDSSTQQTIEKLVSIFQRLVSVLGSSPETLTSSPNARIAYARLAELSVIEGKTDKAIEMLETLNQLFPNNKVYLASLARALSNTGRFEEASPVWRKLASGVQAGGDLWYESKHGLAVALFKTGKQDDAKNLVQQTVRLSPKMPDQWRQQFEELLSQIKPQSDGDE